MNCHSLLADGHVGAMHVHPGAGVVVLDSIELPAHGDMRVATKNALSFALFCVTERAASYLRGQAQPSCVETVKVAGETFTAKIYLLQVQVNKFAKTAEQEVVNTEAVKLMSMDGDMALALIFPGILLVNRHAHQVRHHFR